MNSKTARLVALFVFAALVLSVAGCGPRGLVRVNGEKVTKDEFYLKLERVPVQTPQGAEPAGRYVIQEIIREKLIQQLAKEKGVPATEKQISKKIDALKKQSGGDLRQALGQRGLTIDDLKQQLALQQAFINLVTRSVKVSEKDVKDVYNQTLNLKNSPLKRPEQVLVSAIVTNTKAKSDKAYGMLKAGQEFGTVAMRMSDAPGGKQSQGRLDWFSRGDTRLPPQALAAIYAVQLRSFTQPMQFGKQWVIFRADQKRPAKVTTYNESKDELLERLKMAKASKSNTFADDMKAFAKKSEIVVNAERYKNLPEELKKQIANPPAPPAAGAAPAAQPAAKP